MELFINRNQFGSDLISHLSKHGRDSIYIELQRHIGDWLLSLIFSTIIFANSANN